MCCGKIISSISPEIMTGFYMMGTWAVKGLKTIPYNRNSLESLRPNESSNLQNAWSESAVTNF